MKNKTILISILPIISISTGIILNSHFNNKINNKSNKKQINNNQKVKTNLNNKRNNKKIKDSHESTNYLNLKTYNKNEQKHFKNLSITLNPSFQKALIFSPYIYHFAYQSYEKNKNGVYQLISHDIKIWNHKKTIQVAYSFLNSTYLWIDGVRGKHNDLRMNQNFKINKKEIQNIIKNSLNLNVDAIGLVTNPRIYLDYHYKLKNNNNINLIDKNSNLNKTHDTKVGNTDYFNNNLKNLKSHFDNNGIKMFGFYNVFNLEESAKNWFTHNLINALLILLPFAIEIISNIFCGVVSGLILGTMTSQIKNFILSFGMNLIDSTITKGYLGYAYMASDAFFTMGESEMEFIAAGIGDFFVDGKSISKMQKSFVSESSQKTIEYVGDDDMREKITGNDKAISIDTADHDADDKIFSPNSHNSIDDQHNAETNDAKRINENNENSNEANSHVNLHAHPLIQNSDNINLNQEVVQEAAGFNDDTFVPVVYEENSYGQYNIQLVSNNYYLEIVQEDPYRGIDDSDSEEENDNSLNNNTEYINFVIDENETSSELLSPIAEENFNSSKSVYIGINFEKQNDMVEFDRPFGKKKSVLPDDSDSHSRQLLSSSLFPSTTHNDDISLDDFEELSMDDLYLEEKVPSKTFPLVTQKTTQSPRNLQSEVESISGNYTENKYAMPLSENVNFVDDTADSDFNFMMEEELAFPFGNIDKLNFDDKSEEKSSPSLDFDESLIKDSSYSSIEESSAEARKSGSISINSKKSSKKSREIASTQELKQQSVQIKDAFFLGKDSDLFFPDASSNDPLLSVRSKEALSELEKLHSDYWSNHISSLPKLEDFSRFSTLEDYHSSSSKTSSKEPSPHSSSSINRSKGGLNKGRKASRDIAISKPKQEQIPTNLSVDNKFDEEFKDLDVFF